MRWFSLGLLLSAPSTSATGDDEVTTDEAWPRPTISVETGQPPRLAMTGLRAVATDGRIAFVASRSEYDESGKLELRIAGVDGSMLPLLLDRTDAPRTAPTCAGIASGTTYAARRWEGRQRKP